MRAKKNEPLARLVLFICSLVIFGVRLLDQSGEVIIITTRLDQRSQNLPIPRLSVLVARFLDLMGEVFGRGVVQVVQVPIRILAEGRIVPNLGDPISQRLGQFKVLDDDPPSFLGDLLIGKGFEHRGGVIETSNGLGDRILNESNVQAVAMQTAHVEFWLESHHAVGASEAKDAHQELETVAPVMGANGGQAETYFVAYLLEFLHAVFERVGCVHTLTVANDANGFFVVSHSQASQAFLDGV